MKRKVLVTGATGFIGNYVIQELQKKECSVIATSLHKSKAEHFPWFDKIQYIPFDINQFDDNINYVEYFDYPEIVIHLAWQGLPNYKDPFHLTENLPVHYAFLKNLIDNGLKNINVTGTCFEYGMQEGALFENMDVYPDNPYGIAKNELRIKLEGLYYQSNFSLKWLRLFYMYGEGQNSKSLFSQLERALENGEKEFNMSGGEQIRDFLPVELVADYIVKASLQTKVTGIINCSSNNPLKVKDFVVDFLNKKKKKINLNLGFYPYPDYEPFRFWGNNDKLISIVR